MDDTAGDPKDKNSASTSEGTRTHGENDYAPRSMQVSVKDNLESGGDTLLKMEDVMPQKAPSVNVLFTTPARKVPVKFNAAHIFLEATKDINNNNKGKGKKSSDTKHSTMDDTTGDPKVESDQKTF